MSKLRYLCFILACGILFGLNGNVDAQTIFFLDSSPDAVFQVDPDTGDRSYFSFGSSWGGGPNIVAGQFIDIDPTGDFWVSDLSLDALFHIDGTTGERTIVSDAITGSGPIFSDIRGMAYGSPTSVYMTDVGIQAIYSVHPVSGDRTLVSGSGTGSGTAFLSPLGLDVDSDGTILVVDPSIAAIFRVDPISGDRTVISGSSTGVGEPLTQTRGIAIESNGDLVVTGTTRLIRVSLPSGDRTIVSGPGVGDGPDFQFMNGVTVDSDGSLLVTDNNLDAVIRVDAQTGDRTVVTSDQFPNDTGTGPGFNSPLDVTVIPSAPVERMYVVDTFAAPGGQAIVPIRLDNESPVAGLQVTIQAIDVSPEEPLQPLDPDPLAVEDSSEFASLIGVLNRLELEGFSVSHGTDEFGVTTLLLISLNGQQLEPGTWDLLDLVYEISPDVPVDQKIEVSLSEIVISDPESQALNVESFTGLITFGQPGDVAGGFGGSGDGQINILDIVSVVQLILGIIPEPAVDSFEFYLADINADGYLDVRDVVLMVNETLSSEPTPPTKPVKQIAAAVAHIAIGSVGFGTTQLVPLSVDVHGPIAGFQTSLTFDASRVDLGTPYLVKRAAHLTLVSHVEYGVLRMIVFGSDGGVIAPGAGNVVLIPVTRRGNSSIELTLSQAIASNAYGESVPVTLARGTSGSYSATEFALVGNSPNPFNPQTTIVYNVAEASRIRLIVYNLLGQEIIRLVDQVQSTGQYETRWNGTNKQGLPVASGTYIYRLTSATGQSATRRMTLVK